jgi:hypothetical protein
MDFANMAGGIDADKLGQASLPSMPQALVPTTPTNPYANTAGDVMGGDFMADFLSEESIDTSKVNVQMSPSMQKAFGSTKQVLQEESHGSSPIDRFQNYLSNERRLNVGFSISDLDDMIDYIVEKEKLDNKFKKFNHVSDVSDDEETYEL